MKFALSALSAAVVLLASCSTPPTAPPASTVTAQRPNIIVIVADDLGYGDVDAFSPGSPRTPHIDRLAAEGVKLTAGYVTAPVCSPSRAGLMSGRYQQRFGYDYNTSLANGGGLPSDTPTLAERLRAGGYRTGLVGKWHLGWRPEQRPERRGFEHVFGMPGGNPYFQPNHPGVERSGKWQEEDESGSGPRAIRVFRNGQPAPVDGNLTDAFTEEALQFIERNRAEPFFLYLAYNAPHTPLQAEPSRLERFPATLTRDQRILNAMVAAMDDGVGRISARLRELGIDRNTLVVFVSDNGCPIYLGGACSNAGYSGGKRHLLEGGIRVPFIVRHPAALAPGTYARPVSTLDIAATAVAAAGADDAGLDGVDLRPFLAGRRGDPHRTLFWRLEPGLAVRSGDWKLIKAPRADGKAQETFLFNLAADPQERRNLAAAQPAVVSRLERAYAQWEAQLQAATAQARTEVQPVAGVPVTFAY